jgi:hypothetical protein
MQSATCCLIAASLFFPYVQAQPQSQLDVKGQTALQSSFLTMGGFYLPSVQDTQTVVMFQADDASAAVSYKATLTSRGMSSLRVDSESPSGNTTSVVTATNAASRLNGDAPEKISRLSFADIPVTYLPVIFLAGILNDPRVQIRDLGVVSDGQTQLQRIRVGFGVGNLGESEQLPIDIYLDAATKLVSKITFPQRAPLSLNTFQIIEVCFEKYAVASGLMVPFFVTYWSDGHFINSQTVVSFAVNVGTNESDFSLGDGAQ